MGTFHIRLEIGNVEDSRFQPVDALVDTGASLTRVPRSVLERLGVGPLEPWPFRLADDRQVQYEVGQTQIRLGGRTRFTPVVFGEEASDPLLGAVTLETFGLGVDPIGRRLIPVPGLMMSCRFPLTGRLVAWYSAGAAPRRGSSV